ncbi:class I SAM-dependent methyltransferase [Nonomuraea ferruginea]|uniref:Methyltransferase domain-containing protein n=1 Tax=Nonomuraea ferruginea TaxID=46174 RepID=A0ABT4SX25_9ACTN|nr:methyltransferase domain-containing protein [Nonomuraea ferruginea]MDA0641807.1 methyltransferase domain-containing protein [Nonomuraea ferruginea]
MSNDTTLLLRQFLRSPATIGALVPSSQRLAAAVCAPVPERGEPTVVELGPGTGPFTAEIQRRLAGRGHHLAVELNETMAALLAERFPAVDVVNGDAAKLSALLAERNLGQADVVVSGLPWAAFPKGLQLTLMGAVTSVMSHAGAFTTFSYVHAIPLSRARRFRTLLAERFEEVVAGRTVWRNAPPAFVFHARRPRPRTELSSTMD